MKFPTSVLALTGMTAVTGLAFPTLKAGNPAALEMGDNSTMTYAAADVNADSQPIAHTDKDFINAILETHNNLRMHHAAQTLSWDPKLAVDAVKEGSICDGDHHGPWGQNIGSIGPVPSEFVAKSRQITQAWYNEVKDYNFNKPEFSHETGHFTQLVWRDSKYIGCAWVVCTDKPYPARLYCDYFPRGNWINEGMFEHNVWRYY